MKRLCLTLLLILVALFFPLSAEGGQTPIQIHSVQDLLAITEDPDGSYILMNDLDMTGVDWSCPDFSGTFDGNGHAILNLFLSRPGEQTATSYDGNVKTYETSFVGLFGTLRNATVQNLQLINVRALVDIDRPCFVGSIAGYSEESSITGCTVTGCLELRAFDRMFGVGGIVGYGNGTVRESRADVTLICTDTDPNSLDEQFLGGIFATGFMDVTDCEVVIDGYCSEYGYVHNGGITGMYMQYPLGGGREGKITGNHVAGKITFFECNPDRRAYCRFEAGEVLASWYDISDNTHDFLRDERWEYDKELRPEMCGEPIHTATVVAPGCDTYGYTQFTCTGCGYSYTDAYTLFSHTVTGWTVIKEPTVAHEGLSEGFCGLCGLGFTRTEPKLEYIPTTAPETKPEPTAPTTQPAETAPPPTQPQAEKNGIPGALWVLAAAAAAAVVCVPLLLRPKKKGGKYLKK